MFFGVRWGVRCFLGGGVVQAVIERCMFTLQTETLIFREDVEAFVPLTGDGWGESQLDEFSEPIRAEGFLISHFHLQ